MPGDSGENFETVINFTTKEFGILYRDNRLDYVTRSGFAQAMMLGEVVVQLNRMNKLLERIVERLDNGVPTY